MPKYFGSVQFVIETDSEEKAEEAQQQVRMSVANMPTIVEASADEPVEEDEYGHAG